MGRRRRRAASVAAALWALVAVTGAAGSPPVIKPSTALASQAAFAGSDAVFSVTATGDSPLRFQWRRAGQELTGGTNRTLTLRAVRPEDDGDYDVVVSNASGSATSYAAHLHVVPPASGLSWGGFTNAGKLRLPYRFYLPENYTAARQYPLIIQLHGSSTPAIDESTFATYFPAQFYSHTSYGRQAAEPAVVVYPTRRRGDGTWNDSYVQLMADWIAGISEQWNIDSDRVYLVGTSEGVHAAWDLLGQVPNAFAASGLAAGWKGKAMPETIGNVPVWVWQAADDPEVNVSSSRLLVRTLRLSGGRPIYTEFQAGGHVGGMGAGLLSPALHAWMMTQHRGQAPDIGPRLTILSPPGTNLVSTSAGSLALNGSTEAYGAPVTRVSWENLSTGSKGDAVGTSVWEAAGVSLKPMITNVVVVTAMMASGVPSHGGTTTANDSRAVLSLPPRASLISDQARLRLGWTGATGPCRVQHSTDPATGNWRDLSTNATSPFILEPDGPAGFYRILSQ